MMISFESMVNALKACVDFTKFSEDELALMSLPKVAYCWRQYKPDIFKLPPYIVHVNFGFHIRTNEIEPRLFELIEAVKENSVVHWTTVTLYRRAVVVLPDYKTASLDIDLFDDEL